MNVHCEHNDLVPVEDLKPHPKNRNSHSKEQIERLAKLIAYQGFRHPILVSTLSGFIVAGHGRLAAAKELGLKQVPVDYQDFENEEMEYAFLQSDNAIALWAELDFSGINTDLADMGPFDLDMLGLKEFSLDPPNIDLNVQPEEPKKKEKKLVECPSCKEIFEA